MKSRENIQSALRDFIVAHFPAATKRSISDDDSLLASGIVDSLGVLDVVQFIESEFCITLSDDAVLSENFETIAAIANFVAGELDAACVLQQGT